MSLAAAAVLLATLIGCAAAPPEIEPEPPAEAKLATRVKAALVEAPGMDAAAIFVDASGGTVSLSGFVDNPDQRREAVRVARGVPGVTGVRSNIQVR